MTLIFHGDLGDGTFGSLKPDQIRTNLTNKMRLNENDRGFQGNLTTALSERSLQ